jgi:phosphohistidine phosphatase
MPRRTLILWRHAKSDWSDPSLADIQRPLNARGRRAAPLMAAHIAAACPRPDVIVCSPAERTRQTLDALTPLLDGAAPDIRFDETIYEAAPQHLLACLCGLGSARCALMVGHNPGLQMLAWMLADPDRSDPAALARLETKFPTAAVCVLIQDSGGDWSECAPGTFALTAFTRPKDLAADGIPG